MSWPSNDFNKFANHPFLIKTTLSSGRIEHTIDALGDTGASGYSFIDEKTAQLISEKLGLRPVPLSRPKHLCCFDGRMAKPITHAIYPTMTIKDHSELSCPMFITTIGSHPLILGKPWMNRHGVILDLKYDLLKFKPGRCDHWGSPKHESMVQKEDRKPLRHTELYDPEKALSKTTFLPPIETPMKSSSCAVPSPTKYQILQRRSPSPTAPAQVSVVARRPPKPSVEDASDEDDAPRRDSLRSDSPWSLIGASEPLVYDSINRPPKGSTAYRHAVKARTKKTKKAAARRAAKIMNRSTSSLVIGSVPQFMRVGQKQRRPSGASPPPLLTTPDEDDNEPSSISMIGAASFLKLASPKSQAEGTRLFTITLAQIQSALRESKGLPSRDPDAAELNAVVEQTKEELLNKIPDFLHKFAKVIDPGEAEKLPPRKPYDHKIEFTGDPSTLPRSRVYPLSPKKLEVMEKYLKDNLKKGFISPSQAPFASPILFAAKPNGGLRFCVDYRKLNAITKRNAYPIPLIDETLARVIGCKYISKLDIIAAFNKLRIAQGDEDFTTFITSMGIYKYHVMPFGLTNGPASWQQYMNDMLFEFINKFCQVYLDDILIYSKTRAEHRRHLEQVFAKLEENGLQIDANKCEFFKTEVKFLGVILSTTGLRMDPEKIEVILGWLQPTCLKEVQAFVGFCNFYRRFIKAFSKIAKPLTLMARKEVGFAWSDAAQAAFEALKNAVTKAPILRHYDRKRKAVLESDSSDWCVGGVLSQYDDEGVLHPVAFYSKKMIPAECNYEIYDKELLAIIRCLEHWRPELEGTELPVEIYTDHKGLETFMTSKKLTPRQVRWAETLADYNIRIQYQSGAQNVKADALTRMPGFRPDQNDERERYREQVLLPPERLQLCPIDAVDDLFDRVLQANKDDEDCATYRTAVESGEDTADGVNLRGCTVRDGVLYKGDNLWVPGEPGFLLEIIRDAHDQPSCGHPGMNRTEELIKRYYYWPNMRLAIKRYIRNCHNCQRSKSSHTGRNGLLRPLPIPSQRWVDISIDFVVGLPDSDGSNAICTIIDRLSKERHYAPCTATDKGTDVKNAVKILLHYVFRTHGLPSSIISDRGPQFVAAVWKAFCKRLGIKAKLSTAFHPPTNGQTERANQDIEARLRHFCNYKQDDWSKWLDILEFADNNAKSSATGLSPFFVNKGYQPRMTFGPDITDHRSTRERLLAGEAQAITDEMEAILKWGRENAMDAVRRMTAQANKHRRPAEFEIGDFVWLDRRNIKTARPSDKLDERNLGPFQIVKKRGQAYELELPDTMHIHPVFHGWLLRKDEQDPLDGQQNDPPGPIVLGEEPEWEVDDILQSRYHYHRLQYRVNWSGWPHDRTWYYADGNEFENAQGVVDAYHEAQPNAAGPALRDN